MKESSKLNYDDYGVIQLMSNEALIGIALGRINMAEVAKEVMAHRGYDKNNHWIGFAKAEAMWGAE